MSIGSTHVVNKLEKNSKAIDGQRLIRVIAKKNKEGQYESAHLQESKCISVPVINPEFTQAQLTAMMPHIVGMLANAQDEIVRELIVEKGISSVNDAEIGIDKCIQFLDDSAKGNRITTEYMQKWFMDTYSEPAMEFVCNVVCKFNAEELTVDQASVIEKKVNILRDLFAGFASPKYAPDIPKCKAMIAFGTYLTEENWDARMVGVQAKVIKTKAEKEAELSMDALGF
jgi:hypothetical protein